jgi:ABC-type branched-subunit amino acid transport system substrate-binding protein
MEGSKMKKKKGFICRKMFFVVLAALFLSVLTIPNSVYAAQPKEFVLYHIGDLTGPYSASTGAAGLFSGPDCEKYINEKLGGINGTKLVIKMIDTRNKRDIALAKYAEVAATKPALIVLHQSADMEILKERLKEDKIPALCTSPTMKSIFPPGWEFFICPPYADQFGLFLDWLRTDWRPKGTIRLAIITPDNAYGRSILTPEINAYMKARDIELVASELFPPWDLDATTQMTRVAASKPDVVFGMTMATQPRVVLKAAQAVGLHGKVLIGMGTWAMDRAAAYVAGDLMEGVVGLGVFTNPNENIPANQYFMNLFDGITRQKHQATVVYQSFNVLNAVAYEALKETVKRVGWDKLN